MEKYIKPEVEVAEFATVDVITTSGATVPTTEPTTHNNGYPVPDPATETPEFG